MALAADTIVVHPTSVTGSLGVVMITVNAQGLMEKIGVAPLAIKSGPMKDAGSPFRPLTQPELQVFQGVIDDMYGRFVRLIAESRKIRFGSPGVYWSRFRTGNAYCDPEHVPDGSTRRR